MFGYVVAPVDTLPAEEAQRYRAAYCGHCRTLGERHGLSARFSLTYDMTFLTLLLQSLYEPQERHGSLRCVPHPLHKRGFSVSAATEYAADLSVALTYHKCLDDWQDDHALPQRGYAALLEKRYRDVRTRLPRQCMTIERQLAAYGELEGQHAPGSELCTCFGQLMGELFVWREDEWSAALRSMGAYMGQFICLMDAAIDQDKDARHGHYNALSSLSLTPPQAREPLMMLIGRAADIFERLPLDKDLHLLRSILYAGVWQQYNAHMQKNHPQ